MSSDTPERPTEQPAGIQPIAKYHFIVAFDCTGHEPIDETRLDNAVMEAIGSGLGSDFAVRVQSVFGELVQVRVERLGQGSVWGDIRLYVAAGVSMLSFVAQYKDLHDSLMLLRQHLRSVINGLIRKRFPNSPLPYHTVTVALTEEHAVSLPSTRVSGVYPPPLYSRAFFWYLFSMNLVLMVVIALLVYRAVAIAYLGGP
ncbi:MAG: hypothetical protein JXA09_11815 [Anaerolineae bacterium]|nr:hypothetical protein [Anaerolineae bacterium]